MSSADSATARCGRPCASCRVKASALMLMGGSPVKSLERLTLAHLWVAFAAFTIACFFGVWQMWARSPLPAPFVTPDHYFLSVTAHGVSMAFVLTTFFIMGFGYFTAETVLERPLPGKTWAWLGFVLALAGALMA